MFCSKCGKELVEEAVVCPNCGCWVNAKSRGEKKLNDSEGKERNKETKGLILTIFIITSFTLASLSFILCMAYIGVRISELYRSIYYLRYYDNYYTYYTNNSLIVWSFIFGLLSTGAGVVSFILGLKKERAIKLLSIISMICGIMVCVSSLLIGV